MYILGINAYHGDSSAALLHDGQLVAAVEEERFNRVKHWAGLPLESIRFCLKTAGITFGDIERIAVSFDPKAHQLRRLAYALRMGLSNPEFLLTRWQRARRGGGLLRDLTQAFAVDPALWKDRLHYVEHHRAHAAHAFYPSPFDQAAVLTLDGMGDLCSAMTGQGQAGEIRELDRCFFPHSIGYLYNALTIYLGFPHYGDEYKVMGLAPYGQADQVDQMRELLRPDGNFYKLDLAAFTHHRQGIAMSWDQGYPQVAAFHSPELERRFGPAVQAGQKLDNQQQNLAASLQVVTEEVVCHVATQLAQQTGAENLCLAGGVAMNSVAVGKLTQKTPFKKVYVPCGAADNGTCIGAALWVWHGIMKRPRKWTLRHGYWGADVVATECLEAIQAAGVTFQEFSPESLIQEVIAAIERGEVVGWFQGREEFGARALGARSLLADPRRTDMRDIINTKIKFREKFRPFAPSILAERVGDWFERTEESPFMERVLTFKPEVRDRVPAVVHVDGTGRLQTVHRETNPLYYDLIAAFEQKTGVPILLNTSLNENEPIVHTPQQALSCFLRTKMDAIALGPYWVKK